MPRRPAAVLAAGWAVGGFGSVEEAGLETPLKLFHYVAAKARFFLVVNWELLDEVMVFKRMQSAVGTPQLPASGGISLAAPESTWSPLSIDEGPGKCEGTGWPTASVCVSWAVGMLHEQELGTCAFGMGSLFILYKHLQALAVPL